MSRSHLWGGLRIKLKLYRELSEILPERTLRFLLASRAKLHKYVLTLKSRPLGMMVPDWNGM